MRQFLENPDPAIYFSDNYVVLDLEIDTSHGDYGHPVHGDNKMLLASWKGKDQQVQSRWGGEYDYSDLVDRIERADFLVAHNAKYELGWLRRMGLNMRNVLVFDTKLGEYVLMGNLASGDEVMLPRSTSLDDCCRRRGWKIKDPVVDIMMKHGINPVYHPRPWLQGRCEQDVCSTEDLFLDQRARLQRTQRLGVLFTRCILTPVLADLEFEGMRLDEDRVVEEFDEYSKRFAELEKKMNAITGGINWRSPLQAGAFIYGRPSDWKERELLQAEFDRLAADKIKLTSDQKFLQAVCNLAVPPLGFEEQKRFDRSTKSYVPKRTKAGGRKTDQKVLEALKPKNKKQREFLSLRKELGKVNAALTKNLQFFLGVCKEFDGIFHAVFNQASTATHRLSSSGIATYFELFDAIKKVQFQNLPRVFKRLFRAKEEGWLVGEWDGSQLEFRVAVRLGGPDPRGVSDIVGGHDVHRFTASVLNNCSEEDVDKGQRQDAKPDTFKPLYGGTQGTKAQMKYYEAFRERYPGIASAQKGWVFEVLNSQDKALHTMWGMRYYWPYARVSSSGYVNITSSVYNYPIQALATAEIIPVAIVYFWHRLADEGLTDYIKIVNSVHDSVICEIHPDYVDQFEDLAIRIWHDVYRYLKLVYNLDFETVPLGTGVTVGTHWNEGKENAYNIFVNGKVEKVQ